ncbi:MAG: Rieske 2Fe-2S domain-containing protein [Chloroflexi bacterium]|nr:Rieske 2Fe-2S domain-containing protein [Chloroflexota bacterium]MBI3732050.1 Rieske 2Fe-2S domain-containing protein [Chloroflexota bacterium]
MTQASSTADNKSGLTRRQFLAVGWTVAGLVAVGEAGAATLSFMYPRLEAGSFGGKVVIGSAQEILQSLSDPKAKPVETFKNSGRFYLTRTQDGIIALYRKCVHLGCVVPWNDGEDQFHCPCHGSLYDRKGEVQGGPAPRPLDIFPITEEGGSLVVDTGKQTQRKAYDPSQVYPLKS